MNRIIGLLLVLLSASFYHCSTFSKGPEYYQPKVLAVHGNGERFVGSETCRECHAEIFASHSQTAHYHTSAPAHADNIHGSFEQGLNKLELEEITVEMEQKGSSFYQRIEDKASQQSISNQRFDIVIGSGVKGQSYLSWEDDYLFQLQASYYPPTKTWINSPGYPTQPIQRPVRDGCLKCHVTFATNRDFSGRGNQYDRERMVYRVDCERCHRPSERHVIHHRNHPEATEAAYMLTYDSLSRQQRLDACAQCHSGPRDAIIQGNSFSYLVGENLKEYSRNYYTGVKESELDVHGNQYGLLTSSKCFQAEELMDCMTCHDPHMNQRGNSSYFNQKCMECHENHMLSCSAEDSELASMGKSCIACHMPNTPSQAMSVQLNPDSLETSVYVRTHLIDIYPKERWHH